MSVKKINEENLVQVIRKVKRVPVNKKPYWRNAITKEDLLEIIKDLPNDAVILTSSMDHSYEPIFNIKTGTALFDTYGITEDYGDELTPEGTYGIRKQVVLIS